MARTSCNNNVLYNKSTRKKEKLQRQGDRERKKRRKCGQREREARETGDWRTLTIKLQRTSTAGCLPRRLPNFFSPLFSEPRPEIEGLFVRLSTGRGGSADSSSTETLELPALPLTPRALSRGESMNRNVPSRNL